MSFNLVDFLSLSNPEAWSSKESRVELDPKVKTMGSIMQQAIDSNPASAITHNGVGPLRLLTRISEPNQYMILVIGRKTLLGPSDPQFVLSLEIHLDPADKKHGIRLHTNPDESAPEYFASEAFEQATLRACEYLTMWRPEGFGHNSRTTQ